MNHEFEYQLTVSCNDPDCSEEGQTILETTTASFQGIEEQYRRIEAATILHSDKEDEYQEWDKQQHRAMPKPDEDDDL